MWLGWYTELNHLIKNLAKLNRPTSTHFDLLTFPSEDNIYAEPYGLSLVRVTSPWSSREPGGCAWLTVRAGCIAR